MVIGVVGLGLIGGSLALRLSEKHTVIGVEPCAATVAYALEHKIVSHVTDYAGLVGCDIVFVCAPIEHTPDCICHVYEAVGDSAIITDVASVKDGLPDLPGARFIGGHPMAGTEFSGIKAAKAHLFENAYYVLIRAAESQADWETLAALVRELGAKPVAMTAAEHDRQVAEISHMPHMVAYALAATPSELTIAGTGFYDMTRIARSDPQFWRNIIRRNKENTLQAVARFRARLDAMTDALAGDDDALAQLFADGQAGRIRLEEDRPHLEEYILSADIRDEVGALKNIGDLLAKENINVCNLQIVHSREDEGGVLRLGFRTRSDYNRAAVLLKERGYL